MRRWFARHKVVLMGLLAGWLLATSHRVVDESFWGCVALIMAYIVVWLVGCGMNERLHDDPAARVE